MDIRIRNGFKNLIGFINLPFTSYRMRMGQDEAGIPVVVWRAE